MSGKVTRRPLKWIREATPEEISEAIIACGIEKAAHVSAILLSRCSTELGERMEGIIRSHAKDPRDTARRFLAGGLRSLGLL